MIELLLQADRLLTVDMVDQADAIYRRVAEADPRNAIAVVGMARCALAREDDHEAYRLAARALTIDPQNDMARRMEARLAEILETRGEVPGAAPAAVAQPPGAVAQPPGAAPPVEPAVPPAVPPSADPSPQPASVPPRASADPSPPTPSPDPPRRRSLVDRLRGR